MFAIIIVVSCILVFVARSGTVGMIISINALWTFFLFMIIWVFKSGNAVLYKNLSQKKRNSNPRFYKFGDWLVKIFLIIVFILAFFLAALPIYIDTYFYITKNQVGTGNYTVTKTDASGTRVILWRSVWFKETGTTEYYYYFHVNKKWISENKVYKVKYFTRSHLLLNAGSVNEKTDILD